MKVPTKIDIQRMFVDIWEDNHEARKPTDPEASAEIERIWAAAEKLNEVARMDTDLIAIIAKVKEQNGFASQEEADALHTALSAESYTGGVNFEALNWIAQLQALHGLETSMDLGDSIYHLTPKTVIALLATMFETAFLTGINYQKEQHESQ